MNDTFENLDEDSDDPFDLKGSRYDINSDLSSGDESDEASVSSEDENPKPKNPKKSLNTKPSPSPERSRSRSRSNKKSQGGFAPCVDKKLLGLVANPTKLKQLIRKDKATHIKKRRQEKREREKQRKEEEKERKRREREEDEIDDINEEYGNRKRKRDKKSECWREDLFAVPSCSEGSSGDSSSGCNSDDDDADGRRHRSKKKSMAQKSKSNKNKSSSSSSLKKKSALNSSGNSGSNRNSRDGSMESCRDESEDDEESESDSDAGFDSDEAEENYRNQAKKMVEPMLMKHAKKVLGDFPQKILNKRVQQMTNVLLHGMNPEEEDEILRNRGDQEYIRRTKTGIAGYVPPILSDSWKPCVSKDIGQMYEILGYPDQGECWACQRSDENTVKCQASDFHDLENLFKKYIGKIRALDLAICLEKCYEKNIRQKANRKLKKNQTPLPRWKHVNIYDHFMSHTADSETRIVQATLMTNNMQLDNYKYGLYEANVYDPSVVRPSKDGIKNHIEITKLQVALYKVDPTEMYLSSKTGNVTAVHPSAEFLDSEKPRYTNNHPFCLTEGSM